ncbi:kinesin-like protein KIF21A isoform X2 [Phymastichus coffea]|uniref:kinesin-like protein KIF21A isoform X2 n=1 Tax=Phymastichus coffea TaxID=108790 RepID=UPI00273B26D3|nr:kinesin-like protein KIF21A isoform X2 [Phymastichus coffea]XP_058799696.1 kinesin-like protein KIF21A isoform X2 [Phymastichus coffea]
MADDSSVRVAVRIRPQIAREVIDMCRICTQVPAGEPQVFLGPDKAFTYDYVFDTSSDQCSIYETCVARLVDGALDGYNATVLAYGQTGSGKTYTMGTGFDVEIDEHVVGIIPRAIKHLFDGIAHKQARARERAQLPPEFKVSAQFLELYNEDLKDLLEPGGPRGGARIHEDTAGNIHLAGVECRVVTSPQEALEYLRLGALSRTTGSTQMNTQSSRSHAIFTLHVKQQRCIHVEDPDADVDTAGDNMDSEFETLTAKFHFVDLAGSERLKRTGATGDRAKEGISINCGLLALGNVISALGDKTKKALHVPYRDSKLTRLLQDSLGGNSQTVMIACVSPSDRDFMETLSTLKYANRARNIKNKVTINQDKSSRTIASLRREIQQLQMELLEYRQGKRAVGEDGMNDAWHENQMLNSELQSLRTRVKALSETVDALTAKNSLLLAEKAAGQWLSSGAAAAAGGDVTGLVQGYLQEIEELRARLLEAEALYQQLKKRQMHQSFGIDASLETSMQVSAAGNPYTVSDMSHVLHSDSSSVLIEAKRELQKEKALLASLKQQTQTISNKDGEDAEMEDAENGQESMSEDESDDDSDRKEEDEEEEAIGRELENLTSNIDVKQRLIQELELSQRRLQTMKQHYEDKLAQLQLRIKDTQEERDKVLSSLQQNSSAPTEKVKKLRDEYEKKLATMQKEVKMLQSAKKEHARLLKSQTQNENRLRGLRNELAEMKRAKVKLLNKMREEAQRHKENELKRNREIAQLRKESRRNANMIRTLEAERRMKEVVLRRKQEEVTALRKRDRGLSQKAAGRTAVAKAPNPKALKQRWQTFERTITKQALAKQAAAETEKEMERLLQEREELGRELERLKKQKLVIASMKDDTADIDEEIDNVTSKISYLQDSISECQRAMVEMGDNDGEADGDSGMEALLNTIRTVDEAQYLMQRMLAFTIEQSYIAAQKQLEVRDMETRLNQVAQESDVQHQLLEHVLRDRDLLSLTNSNVTNNSTTAYSPPSSRSSSPDNSENMTQSIGPDDKPRSIKVRRRTTQPQELLYGTNADNQKNEDQNQNHNHPLTRVPSAPGSLKGLVLARNQYGSGLIGSPTLSRRDSTSPRPLRRALHAGGGSMEQVAHMDTSSPPSSPMTYRRFNSREENVFSRLTASRQTLHVEHQPTKGVISNYQGKVVPRAILQCTHVAEGHSKAVLSICATNDLLFSGSKDRTVKVWDLGTGIESMSLGGHPNNVVVVKYSAVNRLVFSVSLAYVKIWDLRSGNSCIKTLFSSGQAQSGSLNISNTTRTVQLPVGETTINDVALGLDDRELYTASSDKVRIWDLRKIAYVGKLSTPHSAAVMCLSATEDGRVITGSKDHLISIVEPNMSGQSFSLSPPHYDGVECLSTYGNILFSGSRDMCIKRWDLGRMEIVQSLNNAHKDWIQGLCLINSGSVMISGCRAGMLRAWTVPNFGDQMGECSLLGEVRAHTSAINATVSNQQHIFTASSSGEVKLWRIPDSSLTMSTSTVSL